MAVLLCWAPTRLVKEHEKDVPLFFRVNVVQPSIQIVELQQALWHEVVFDALVLEVLVHCLDQLQVGHREADQLIWRFVLVQGYHKRSVESIVTEKLQFLSIVVPSQCLFRAFHVEDVKEKVWVLILDLVIKRCAVYRKVGLAFLVQMRLED